MAKTRGTGLLTVWTDIDPEYEDAFNRRYDSARPASTGASSRNNTRRL